MSQESGRFEGQRGDCDRGEAPRGSGASSWVLYLDLGGGHILGLTEQLFYTLQMYVLCPLLYVRYTSIKI